MWERGRKQNGLFSATWNPGKISSESTAVSVLAASQTRSRPAGRRGSDQLCAEKMIRDAVYALLEEAGELFPVSITISIPAGVEAAKKTFNPVLGIEGGISVLGTSGIVEPMSEEALVETIRTHLNVLKAEGRKWVIAVPGNMGAGFLERYLVEHGKFCTDAHQGSNAADNGCCC